MTYFNRHGMQLLIDHSVTALMVCSCHGYRRGNSDIHPHRRLHHQTRSIWDTTLQV